MKNYELMNLVTRQGNQILSNAIQTMCNAYLDYVNNYLLIDTWAESYGITPEASDAFYEACKAVYNAEASDY